MSKELDKYWYSIPVGRENAVTYHQLEGRWEMSERQVRKTLAELSSFDNGDKYILIRSSAHKGFYRTDNLDEIEAYKRECRSRAIKTFAPLKKISRVTRDAAAVNYNFFNNLRMMRTDQGIKQSEICKLLADRGIPLDVSVLSRIESGYVLPTPALLSALADILHCEPYELVAMERDSLEAYALPLDGMHAAF